MGSKEMDEKEETNVIPFARPANSFGGKGGGVPWLLEVPEGSYFLIRNVGESKQELLAIQLIWKTEISALIRFQKTGGQHYVYPLEFCKENAFHEYIHKGAIAVDGSGDWTDQSE